VSDWPEDEVPGWEQLEQNERQRAEEEALARGRQILAAFRRDNARFENDMAALNESVRKLTCKV
jgi:hypothetical protein